MIVSWVRYCLWYRLTHPRCLVRHHWGADLRMHEEGILYEAYVECLRCDASVVTYSPVGGQTPEGKRIGRPFGYTW